MFKEGEGRGNQLVLEEYPGCSKVKKVKAHTHITPIGEEIKFDATLILWVFPMLN